MSRLKKVLPVCFPFGFIFGLIILDIWISGNVFHPLAYFYRPLSSIICHLPSTSECVGERDNKKNESSAVAFGNSGAVATSQHLASEVGLSILRNGGNAVDAAVAIGYALAVTEPCCGNIGGGGFMLIHLANGKNTALNFREKAPLKSSKDMYLDSQGKVINALSSEGYLAVGVPGTVKGLEYALKKYGSISRRKVMQPAIDLAVKGFELQPADVRLLKQGSSRFRDQTNASRIFLKHGSDDYKSGDYLVQKNLAQTLTLILNQGEFAFYRGEIAHAVIKASYENKGILSLEDFAKYTVEETAPVACSYRQYIVLSAPLPGGGSTLCEMLNILEGYDLRTSGFHSSKSLHHLLCAMLYSFADRNQFLGDPKYVHSPLARLLSKSYAASLRAKIPQHQAISPKALDSSIGQEGSNTTHYSVRDRVGNVAAVTYTINSYFGAGVIAGETGFFLNNEMNDFNFKSGEPNNFGLIQSAANRIEPGKRPLSSMSPTIVLQQGQPFLVTGSPGGSTIPTTVLQVVTNVIDHNMSLSDAVKSPRLHFQGTPNIVFTEPYGLANHIFLDLWKMGYKVTPFLNLGVTESIRIDPTTGKVTAVSDIRRPNGKALAY